MSCKGDTRTQRCGGRGPAEQTAARSLLPLFPPLRPATDAEPIRAGAAARRGQAGPVPARPGSRGQLEPTGSYSRRYRRRLSAAPGAARPVPRAPPPRPGLSLRARRRAAANQRARRGTGGSGRGAGAAMEDVSAKFVSQKISRTRWRPLPAAALQPPDVFATGSWDNEVPAGRPQRRGATFPPGRGAGGGGTPRRLGPLRLRRLVRGSGAGAGREHCLARQSRPSLDRAVLMSPRKPLGPPPARQRYPPGQALPSGWRRLPQERCLLPSLAEGTFKSIFE